MTEAEWQACDDALRMLASIRDRVSARKADLFAGACGRRVWPWLTDECRALVQAIERYADDPSQSDVGSEVCEAAFEAAQYVAGNPARAAFHAVLEALLHVWREWAGDPDEYPWAAEADKAGWRAERKGQAGLVRDLFGPLPFRQVRLDSSLLAWNGGAVIRLAQALYEGRELPSGHLDRPRLAVLADALDEAGCLHPDMVGHLREPDGVHVRGCWVVDLLLGKA